jgi:predicted DNA-binding protein
MARTKLPTTVYLTEEQYQLLRQLHELTKVPMAEYIREGVDLIIKKHRKELQAQLSGG